MFSRNCKHYQTQQKHCKHHTFGILNATSIIYAMDMGRVFAMLYLYITFTLALAIARCVQFSWIAYIACECVLLLNELNTIHDGGWNCCSDNDSWIGFRVSPIRLTIFSSMYLNCNIAEAVAENAALYFILNVSCKVTMTLYYARISIYIWLCPFFRWISMVWYVSVWQNKRIFFFIIVSSNANFYAHTYLLIANVWIFKYRAIECLWICAQVERFLCYSWIYVLDIKTVVVC